MTHIELLLALSKKLPRLSREEAEVLKNIVAGIAKKGDSLFKFYEEVTTKSDFPNLPLIKEISEKYSVPNLYRDHIDDRFFEFKKNLITVCEKNKEAIKNGKKPGTDPSKWVKKGVYLFSSTEKKTIEMVGGISTICDNLHMVGYFDFLKSKYCEAATEVSKIKYSLLLTDEKKSIEYKE